MAAAPATAAEVRMNWRRLTGFGFMRNQEGFQQLALTSLVPCSLLCALIPRSQCKIPGPSPHPALAHGHKRFTSLLPEGDKVSINRATIAG
jgi:hypothetical protein